MSFSHPFVFFRAFLILGLGAALALLPHPAAGAGLYNMASAVVTARTYESFMDVGTWRLPDLPAPDNAWHDNDQAIVTGLPPGYYKVEYKTFKGYQTPTPRYLRLVRGVTTMDDSAQYVPLSDIYELRDDKTVIPTQKAPWGKTMTVAVYVDDFTAGDGHETRAQTLFVDVSPAVAGPVTLTAMDDGYHNSNVNRDVRLVEFTPAQVAQTMPPRLGPDLRPFTITLSFQYAAKTFVKSFLVEPEPPFAAETETVSHVLALPDATSNDYFTITEAHNKKVPTLNELNLSAKGAREVTISGKEVVIDINNDPHKLYDRLQGYRFFSQVHNSDISKLTINAETLRVRSWLTLPQCNVILNVKNLFFEWQSASTQGCIDVTPLPRTDVTTPGSSATGASGLTAGSITLNVENFDLGQTPGAPLKWYRFKLNGGLGGKGGPGAAGQPGLDIPLFGADSDLLGDVNLSVQQTGNFKFVMDSASIARIDTHFVCYKPDDPKYAACLGTLLDGNTYGVYNWYSYDSLNGVNAFVSSQQYAITPTQLATYNASGVRNGGPAVAPGAAGIGGNGGTLTQPLWQDLGGNGVEFWQAINGANATFRPNTKGGRRGRPSCLGLLQADIPYRLIYPPWTLNAGDVVGADKNWFLQPGGLVPGATNLNQGYTQDGADAQVPGQFGYGLAGSRVTAKPTGFVWLTPPMLRHVVNYARDAYLGGNFDTVRTTLDDYDQVLAQYELDPNYPALSEDDHNDFQQLHAEIRSMLHGLAANLDYYGYPAGWAPMLSLEFTKKLFEDEISRSTKLLYLSYWLRSENRLFLDRKTGMIEARNQLRQQVTELQGQQKSAITTLKSLQDQSGIIQLDIKALRDDIAKREADLEAQAGHNADAAAKLPWWKKTLRVASVVCSVVPWGQPALGAVGMGLNIISNAESTDGAILTGVDSLASAFSASNISNSFNALGSIDPSQFSTNPQNPALKDAIGKSVGAVKSMQASLQKLDAALDDRGADKAAVKAALAELIKNDQIFIDLHDRLDRQLAANENFGRQIKSLTQKLGELTNSITKDLLTDQSLGENLSATAGFELDGRADAYLKDIEKRACDRLLYYHYLMAKAYEYRMLQSYDTVLNVQNLVADFKTFAENVASTVPSDSQYLSMEKFSSLMDTYQGVLSDITNKIVNSYVTGAWVHQTLSFTYDLNADQLAALDRGEPVKINFFGDGFIPSNFDDVRIVSLSVSKAQVVHANGSTPGALEELILSTQHSGLSSLAYNGHTYLFRHYYEQTNQPITWSTTYLLKSGARQDSTPAVSDYSLLASLITNPPSNLEFFVHPAAWADLTLTAQRFQLSESLALKYKALQLTASCTYLIRPAAKLINRVAVKTNPPGLMPYITVGTADVAGHKNGRGVLDRFVSGTAAVTIGAPRTYGNYTLKNCTNEFGDSYKYVVTLGSPSASYSVTPTGGKQVFFNYTLNNKNTAQPDWALYE